MACICVDRKTDKRGNYTHYVLMDIATKKVVTMDAKTVKQYFKSLKITNLKMTEDGKLIVIKEYTKEQIMKLPNGSKTAPRKSAATSTNRIKLNVTDNRVMLTANNIKSILNIVRKMNNVTNNDLNLVYLQINLKGYCTDEQLSKVESVSNSIKIGDGTYLNITKLSNETTLDKYAKSDLGAKIDKFIIIDGASGEESLKSEKIKCTFFSITICSRYDVSYSECAFEAKGDDGQPLFLLNSAKYIASNCCKPADDMRKYNRVGTKYIIHTLTMNTRYPFEIMNPLSIVVHNLMLSDCMLNTDKYLKNDWKWFNNGKRLRESRATLLGLINLSLPSGVKCFESVPFNSVIAGTLLPPKTDCILCHVCIVSYPGTTINLKMPSYVSFRKYKPISIWHLTLDKNNEDNDESCINIEISEFTDGCVQQIASLFKYAEPSTIGYVHTTPNKVCNKGRAKVNIKIPDSTISIGASSDTISAILNNTTGSKVPYERSVITYETIDDGYGYGSTDTLLTIPEKLKFFVVDGQRKLSGDYFTSEDEAVKLNTAIKKFVFENPETTIVTTINNNGITLCTRATAKVLSSCYLTAEQVIGLKVDSLNLDEYSKPGKSDPELEAKLSIMAAGAMLSKAIKELDDKTQCEVRKMKFNVLDILLNTHTNGTVVKGVKRNTTSVDLSEFSRLIKKFNVSEITSEVTNIIKTSDKVCKGYGLILTHNTPDTYESVSNSNVIPGCKIFKASNDYYAVLPKNIVQIDESSSSFMLHYSDKHYIDRLTIDSGFQPIGGHEIIMITDRTSYKCADSPCWKGLKKLVVKTPIRIPALTTAYFDIGKYTEEADILIDTSFKYDDKPDEIGETPICGLEMQEGCLGNQLNNFRVDLTGGKITTEENTHSYSKSALPLKISVAASVKNKMTLIGDSSNILLVNGLVTNLRQFYDSRTSPDRLARSGDTFRIDLTKDAFDSEGNKINYGSVALLTDCDESQSFKKVIVKANRVVLTQGWLSAITTEGVLEEIDIQAKEIYFIGKERMGYSSKSTNLKKLKISGKLINIAIDGGDERVQKELLGKVKYERRNQFNTIGSKVCYYLLESQNIDKTIKRLQNRKWVDAHTADKISLAFYCSSDVIPEIDVPDGITVNVKLYNGMTMKLAK